MSYVAAAALQEAVFARLAADPALAAQVGGAIFDSAPAGTIPPTYVSLGPETVRERSDKTGHGAEHEFTVSVVTSEAGFASAKAAAATISDALVDAPLTLSRGRVVGLWFVSARAKRVEKADVRRIDIRFRARIEND